MLVAELLQTVRVVERRVGEALLGGKSNPVQETSALPKAFARCARYAEYLISMKVKMINPYPSKSKNAARMIFRSASVAPLSITSAASRTLMIVR